MNLQLLESFVVVAEEENVSRAAIRLRIAQPALSRRIQQLESDIGAELFIRHGRSLRLSAAGSALLSDARAILAAGSQAAQRALDVSRGNSGRLSIGVVEVSAIGGVTARIIRRFRERHPGIIIDLQPMISAEQWPLLRDRRLDLGFVYWAPDEPWTQTRTVAQDAVALALPARHPLARRKRIRLGDLAGEPFVQLPRWRSPIYHDLVMAATLRGGLRLRVVQEVAQEIGILGLVASGLGLAIVVSSWANALPRGVVLRRMDDLTVPLSLQACWQREDASPALRLFLDELPST
jgi:DNA-binding transcriptional LysR family regulator